LRQRCCRVARKLTPPCAQAPELAALRASLAQLSAELAQTQASKASLEAELAAQGGARGSAENEKDRAVRKKAAKDAEAADLRRMLDALAVENKQKATALNAADDNVSRLEAQIREQAAAQVKATKEKNQMQDRLAKLQNTVEEHVAHIAVLTADNARKVTDLKRIEDALNQAHSQTDKAEKMRDLGVSRLVVLEKSKSEVEAQRDELKAEVAALERGVEQARKCTDAEVSKAEDIRRELDALAKSNSRVQSSAQRQADALRLADSTKKTLEVEIEGLNADVARQARRITELQRDLDKCAAEADAATKKRAAALEDVRAREVVITDLQRLLAEGEAKLKQQERLYDSVRTDRNTQGKFLIEAEGQVQDVSLKLDALKLQAARLDDELAAKDEALLKEHLDRATLERERDAVRADVGRAAARIRELESAAAVQVAEADALKKLVAAGEVQRQRQQKELAAVLSERDLLSAQLVHRNDELADQYEDAKTQQSALAAGELRLRELQKEIRMQALKLGDVNRELDVTRKNVSGIDELKREVQVLGRELLAEKNKVKSLTLEAQTPLNVHRYRMLEGTDPAAFELMQTNQTLQKRLMKKTEEVEERSLQVRDTQQQVREAEEQLARMPGPEIAAQLSACQGELRNKTRQMKVRVKQAAPLHRCCALHSLAVTRRAAGSRRRARGAADAAAAEGEEVRGRRCDDRETIHYGFLRSSLECPRARQPCGDSLCAGQHKLAPPPCQGAQYSLAAWSQC
jgi:chromosome segregation ATPase